MKEVRQGKKNHFLFHLFQFEFTDILRKCHVVNIWFGDLNAWCMVRSGGAGSGGEQEPPISRYSSDPAIYFISLVITLYLPGQYRLYHWFSFVYRMTALCTVSKLNVPCNKFMYDLTTLCFLWHHYKLHLDAKLNRILQIKYAYLQMFNLKGYLTNCKCKIEKMLLFCFPFK